ncbi:uncharacterized protein LOC119552965 [Drosophila subpulchrella]|uniref:uncharacterized protein LOC119552965 n=1 Tax=Drosophila subpulchrella TaxID=1486046 RepID=UPI0018A13643|nr:uncharacterized protein LOC119552965 [Drosophila subpulchrella]
MHAISVFALIILVAYTNATPADHAHHAGPGKDVGISSEVIHWTTGTQTKGAATLNDTRAVNTTDLPETLAAAYTKETQGSADAPVSTVELESTRAPAPSSTVESKSDRK